MTIVKTFKLAAGHEIIKGLVTERIRAKQREREEETERKRLDRQTNRLHDQIMIPLV